MVRRQILPAVLMVVVFTVGLGLLYPLAITGVAQTTMSAKADGSLVEVDGAVVGSSLIGQNFTAAKYFHPRPSAAGTDGYDGMSSAGSNLGPTSADLATVVRRRVRAYRKENGLSASTAVPVDAVTASGSGLDPHISVANAKLQIARVADARSMSTATVAKLVDEHTDGRSLGFLGAPGVNVLELNVALDALAGRHS
ncbi:MAG: K(+)-transporting ATPase subunit C [Acidimicrobiales bacterium]